MLLLSLKFVYIPKWTVAKDCTPMKFFLLMNLAYVNTASQHWLFSAKIKCKRMIFALSSVGRLY